jgi:hypothetical protein
VARPLEIRVMSSGNRRRLWWSAFAAALCAVATWVAPAGAEQVNDGGFEAATCNATDCADPAWMLSSTSAFANGTGPICRSGTGSGNTACTSQGSAPFSGSTWARLGAGYKASAMFGGGILSSLEQTVAIPTAAALRFRLRIINVAGPIGEFTVKAGDAQLFAATDATPGFGSYAPVTVDLSSLAGTSPPLRFEGSSSQDPVGPLDSFDVDDISVSPVESTAVTPDPRCKKLRAKFKRAKAKGNKKLKRKLRKKLRKLGC